MLCSFMSVRSRRISSLVTAAPLTGELSCRLTPRNLMGVPLSLTTRFSIFTSRTPTLVVMFSPAQRSVSA